MMKRYRTMSRILQKTKGKCFIFFFSYQQRRGSLMFIWDPNLSPDVDLGPWTLDISPRFPQKNEELKSILINLLNSH